MRIALWFLLLSACSRITTTGGDDADDTGGGSSAVKVEVCGDARDCRPDDAQCETYEYKDLPSYCWEVCHTYCCNYFNGNWRLESFTCMPDGIDSGIDTDAWQPDGL